MTSEEFMVEARKTKRDWFLTYSNVGGGIRRENPEHYFACPITAVCKQVTGKIHFTDHWRKAARALRLSENFASDVVDAADDTARCDKELRKELLRATGLRK